MASIGLIVGSGLAALGLDAESRSPCKTPYGEPSSALLRSRFGGYSVLCIARHGEAGRIPPHRVNYRANIWALHAHGVRLCIGINTVGVIAGTGFRPGGLAVPDQLIDYTWGREHTFDDGLTEPLRHVDFTEPFDPELRAMIAAAAASSGPVAGRGVYGVAQGPRLETAAEIRRMAQDGCTMVGMTAMPEAALAREIGMRYATCAVGVNFAAGLAPQNPRIHDQLEQFLGEGMTRVRAMLEVLLPNLQPNASPDPDL